MANKESKSIEQLKAEAEQAQMAYEKAKREIAKKEFEEAQRKKAELAAKKDKRKKEVDDAVKNAIELIKAYNEDYGKYSITDHFNDLSFLFGSKPWKFFI
jgi:membrane protein involved in colicin uptake